MNAIVKEYISMKIKITLLALICALVLGIGAYAVYGSGDFDLTNDPLISLSYLNEVFWPRIEEAIEDAGGFVSDDQDEEETTDEEPEDPAPIVPANEYEVLHLVEGDIVLADTPCEIILRSGSASAYLSGGESGIADLTAGVDLKEGEDLTANHLLLVPRGGDGRGFKVESSEVYIMVRGGFSIVTE